MRVQSWEAILVTVMAVSGFLRFFNFFGFGCCDLSCGLSNVVTDTVCIVSSHFDFSIIVEPARLTDAVIGLSQQFEQNVC